MGGGLRAIAPRCLLRSCHLCGDAYKRNGRRELSTSNPPHFMSLDGRTMREKWDYALIFGSVPVEGMLEEFKSDGGTKGCTNHTQPHFSHTGQPGCPWLMEGMPRGGTLAICGRALVKDVDERRRFMRDLRTTVEELQPDAIAYYGSTAYGVGELLESFDVEVWVYPSAGRGKLVNGSADGQR